MIGDGLVLLGASLYAASNVAQEQILKQEGGGTGDRIE